MSKAYILGEPNTQLLAAIYRIQYPALFPKSVRVEIDAEEINIFYVTLNSEKPLNLTHHKLTLPTTKLNMERYGLTGSDFYEGAV